MSLHTFTQLAFQELSERREKIVFAESCTCGLLASSLGQLPGVSNYLCGSSVVYRAGTKQRWLGVKKSTIRKYTTESQEVVEEIAQNVLQRTPEANWSIGIVGHLGPDAPKEKDGLIYICICRRTKKGRIKIKDHIEHRLKSKDRSKRQHEAAEVAFTHLARLLKKMSEKTLREQRRQLAG